jgi:predicted nicotinamide N-methyase
MRPPEQRGPDIIAGRRVRRVDLELGALRLFVLEAADADALLEETVAGEGNPYAAILWPSAIAVAARLVTVATRGEHVLDIAAGTGLIALTAAKLGCRATALDHDPFARALVAESAALQKLRVRVHDFDVRSAEPLPRADVVVMADLLYEPDLARTAATRAREAVDAGARVIIGDPARYGRAEFDRALSTLGVRAVFDDVVVRVPGESQPARVGVAVIG